ncbi:MAG: alpha/beta hydrolase [Treponemataceae bacterium]|nr:alpha/beta hydrolase [Treponemataceae bacterium]
MKKKNIIGCIFLGMLAILVVFLATVFIVNKIKSGKEKELLANNPGRFVEINGHNMCIYEAGKGEHTIVFLSGSGTVSPILDFKSLYSLLSDDFKIVVIEKFGYGFSDVVDEERSFETILRQDREVLSKSGIKAPYILCPHSMSGLEAIMWAQKYPEEIEGIVGLDMVVPEFYDGFDYKGVVRLEKIGALAREMGLIRLFYTDGSLPPALSSEDKKIYKALAAKKAVNCDIAYETMAVSKACKKINENAIPEVPVLMFLSKGAGNLGESPKEYAAKLSSCKVIELDCGHYVHNFEYERISTEMKSFIESL